MGTNYYANIGTIDEPKLVHLGKTAYGIRFAFRWNPDHYTDYEGFTNFVLSYPVSNHFGNPVDSKHFVEEIVPYKMDEPPIAPAYRKAGKGELVHVVKEVKESKIVGEHHFVDEDFD